MLPALSINFPLSQSEGLFMDSIDHYPADSFSSQQSTSSSASLPNNLSEWLTSSDAFQGYEFLTPHLVQNPQQPYCSEDSNLKSCLSELSGDSDLENELQELPASSPPLMEVKNEMMDVFPPEKISDFKHVIYNHLVENYNHSSLNVIPFVEPITVTYEDHIRHGFRFNECRNPDKILPELYGQHIHRQRLDLENQESVFINDLYKFYLRAALELLGKYFQKVDKYTFLYDEQPLFVPGAPLREAEMRIKSMRTRARKRTTDTDVKEEGKKQRRKRNSSN